jgi:ERCC4-related helicase
MAVSSQLDDLLVVQRSFYRTRFDDFALIVIDECHHAKGKNPLAEIMRHLHRHGRAAARVMGIPPAYCESTD